MKKVEVSIIIVNYNTLDLTMACIDSILQHTKYNNYEIILVDNASTDGSVDFFSKFPNIIFIANPDNLGFGSANNVGVEKASGDYIFLLNSDTIIKDDIIAIFYNYSKSHEADGPICLGSSLLDGKKMLTESYGNFPSIMQELSNLGLGKILPKYIRKKTALASIYKSDEISVVDYISGADWFLPRDIFNKVNGFDSNFFMYFEEVDLAYRLKKNGCPSIILPHKSIVHYGGQSTGATFSIKKFSMFMNSKSLFYRKHRSRLSLYMMKYLTQIFYSFRPRFKPYVSEIAKIIKES